MNHKTKRCGHCDGSGLLYSGDPSAINTPSSPCEACDGTGKLAVKQNNVQKLIEWLELEPTKAINIVFNYGSFKQPIGQLSVCYRFDGTQTMAGVLLQSEDATEVVDDALAGTFLEMLPPHVGLAA